MAGEGVVSLASLADLSARTGQTYEGAEATRAATLLDDASAALVGYGFDPSDEDANRLRLACQCVCNAVAHKLARDAALEAVSSESRTVGDYTRSLTFVAPTGSITFLRQDLALLGLGTQQYRSVQARTAFDEED